MPMITINVGCVAREVVDAVEIYPGSVGVIASAAQAGFATRPGYSGMSMLALRMQLSRKFALWRDHFDGDPGELAADDALQCGVFVDSARLGLYLRAASLRTPLEVGCGENPSGDVAHRVMLAREYGCNVRYVSAWYGTDLRDGHNALDLGQLHIVEDARALSDGAEFRAHNCDFLGDDDLRRVRDAGATQFNFAPEVGYLVSRRHEARLRQVAVDDGDERWRRWHSSDCLYGGHYLMERLPRDERERRWGSIVDDVRGWIECKRQVLAT